MRCFGTAYAGFYYPESLPSLNADSIIYCVGAGEDISHDIEVAHTCGATVHIFDPTPRAIQHIDLVKRVLDGEKPVANRRFGGGDPKYWSHILNNAVPSETIQAHPWGIYTSTHKSIRFYTPTNPEYVSCSVVEGMKSDQYMEVEVKTLQDTMAELGHTRIDLLKLDIEGCECDVLDSMLDSDMYPTYISVDFDLGWTGESIRDLPRCKATIKRLFEKGYKLLRQNGPEWSFWKATV